MAYNSPSPAKQGRSDGNQQLESVEILLIVWNSTLANRCCHYCGFNIKYAFFARPEKCPSSLCGKSNPLKVGHANPYTNQCERCGILLDCGMNYCILCGLKNPEFDLKKPGRMLEQAKMETEAKCRREEAMRKKEDEEKQLQKDAEDDAECSHCLDLLNDSQSQENEGDQSKEKEDVKTSDNNNKDQSVHQQVASGDFGDPKTL